MNDKLFQRKTSQLASDFATCESLSKLRRYSGISVTKLLKLFTEYAGISDKTVHNNFWESFLTEKEQSKWKEWNNSKNN